MTIWLPRWPVQRRLLDRPELRKVPVFVCRRERRGMMTVASWAWAEPPRTGSAPQRRMARMARMAPGMSLAESMAVLALAHGSRACHIAEIDHDDPVADRAALARLIRWCRRFSPTVGIEATAGEAAARGLPESPECILLDVTRTAEFFGGEGPLVRTVVWTLAARGLHARAAVADTPGAAWAAAHHTDLVSPGLVKSGVMNSGAVAVPQRGAGPRRRWAVVPRGEAATALAGLPVSALRLDEAALVALGELGIDSIGDVLRLSVKSLASRFPAALSRRRAQFLGTLSEPLEGLPAAGAGGTDGAEGPHASWAFDLPVPLDDAAGGPLASVLERLIADCVAPLAARGEGVLALQVRLDHARGCAADGTPRAAAPTVIDVGLFRPSVSVRHLLELVHLRLGRIHLRCGPGGGPRELEGITVEVVAAAAVACRQRSLFSTGMHGGHDGHGGGETAASRAADVALLLDRLAGRLGRPAVFEPRPVADPQPEHAWIAVAPNSAVATGAAAGRARRRHEAPSSGPLVPGPLGSAPSGLPAGRRPIWMPRRPVPLEPLREGPISVVPAGAMAEARLPVRFRLGDQVHRVVTVHGPERIETAWWRGPTVRRDYHVVETESGARFWIFRSLRDGGWFLHGVFA